MLKLRQYGEKLPRKVGMQDSIVSAILEHAKLYPTVTPEELKELKRFLLGQKKPRVLVNARQACSILGGGTGRSVSRQYLKSLVDEEKIHCSKPSKRKTMYYQDELLALMGM